MIADERARAAARNNAEWCDSVCRANGIQGRFDSDAWVAPTRTPRYYPDAVTLEPGAVAASILRRIDAISPGCSIKDSFAALDLALAGFEVVREAEWIWREPPTRTIAGPRELLWAPIETANELVAWEVAWGVDNDSDSPRLFRPALLRDPAITFIGCSVDGSILAGAIANRSGPAVVGLSNVFATDGDLDRAWRGSLQYLDAALPGVAIVGYESGAALAAPLRRGFVSVGPLRIWIAES